MKRTLKFMLALGNARLVMLEDKGEKTFYSKSLVSPSNKRTDLKRIAFSLATSR